MLSNAYHVVHDGRAYLHVLILGASYYVRKATEQTVPTPRDLSDHVRDWRFQGNVWAAWSDPTCPVKLKAESGTGVALPLLVNWKELEWADPLLSRALL